MVGVIYYNQNKERLAKVENLTNGEKTMSNQEGEFCMPMQKGDTIQIINKYNTTYKSIYNGGDTIIVILSKPSEVEYDEALVLGYS